ncbi:hypothetical protein AML18_10140 [Escherichia coli]|nr:hypothetical protein [Escherichia coli]KYS08051.1 hypothetical protein AML18_10140 [Escherichia coli]
MNNEDSTRKTSTGMHLCFSPLSKKLYWPECGNRKVACAASAMTEDVMSRIKLPAWYGRSSGLKAEKSGGKRKMAPAWF